MKNSIFYLIISLFAINTSLNAQLQKGKILIGSSSNLLGNLNQLAGGGLANNAGFQFGKIKSEYNFPNSGNNLKTETTITAFNFSPTVGGFVSDQLLIGASAGFFFFQLKDEDGDKDGFTALSISPHIRAYFKKEGKTLPYAEARGGIIRLKYKGDDESTSNPFLGVKLGTAFFLNPYLSLDLFADYVYSWNKEDLNSAGAELKEKQSLFGLGIGFSFFLDGKTPTD